MSHAIYTYIPCYTNCSGIRIVLGEYDFLSAAKDKILSFARSNQIPRKHRFHVLLLRDGFHYKTNYYFYDRDNDIVRCASTLVQP